VTQKPARTKKRSHAKKFAEIERISILGAVSRIGPVGLWMYANAFVSAAKTLPNPEALFEPVRYYLTCHSIELGLKAYLSLGGASMLDLSEGAFGHNLRAILAAAEAQGLDKSVALSTEQKGEIRNTTTYYNGKLFEYPAYGEALRGYPSLPSLPLLLTAATILVDSLAKPCREAE
jgi:hypothetical protein